MQKYKPRGRSVISQYMLCLQKFTQCLNITSKLLVKFHAIWSPFDSLLLFILFKQVFTTTGAKWSFHGSISYPSCRSI